MKTTKCRPTSPSTCRYAVAGRPNPAIFSGHVDWINPVTQMFEAAPNLPVQVHIEWTSNDTTALETIDVLTNHRATSPWANSSTRGLDGR